MGAGGASEGPGLIVEDDEVISELLTAVIGELAGRRTLIAGDGKTVLAMIRRQRPAGVFVEIMLPWIEGSKGSIN